MTYLQRKPGSLEEMIDGQTKKFREDSGYQQMFKKELEKSGKGIGSMTPAEKKAFFNKIDAKYSAKNETADPKADDHNAKKVDGYTDPKKGEKKPIDVDNLKAEEAKDEAIGERIKVENLSDTIKSIWLKSAEDLEEMKKSSKYLKAQDVAPEEPTEKKEKKEGYESMVPNKKDDEKDMKRKQTMTGEKATKIEMEPKVDYNK